MYQNNAANIATMAAIWIIMRANLLEFTLISLAYRSMTHSILECPLNLLWANKLLPIGEFETKLANCYPKTLPRKPRPTFPSFFRHTNSSWKRKNILLTNHKTAENHPIMKSRLTWLTANIWLPRRIAVEAMTKTVLFTSHEACRSRIGIASQICFRVSGSGSQVWSVQRFLLSVF